MNLTSPSQVAAWCAARGFHPNRTLGQNFLIDRNILEALLDAAALPPGARVLEVGPGLGVVTEGLLARGARVTAIEKDARLADWLRTSLAGDAALTVQTADLLDLDLDVLLATRFDALVSNLPYSCGTRILIEVGRHPAAPPSMTVTVQLEVAERLAAGPGAPARGLAGVWLQRLYDVTLVREIKPTCFWPRPEIDSAIVHLARHDRHALDPAATLRFQDLTRLAFMHRRKQLGSTLRHARAPDTLAASEVAEMLGRCGLEPRVRAEELSVAQWCALAQEFA